MTEQEPMSNAERYSEALDKIVVRCCQGMISPMMRDVISIAQEALASTEQERASVLETWAFKAGYLAGRRQECSAPEALSEWLLTTEPAPEQEARDFSGSSDQMHPWPEPCSTEGERETDPDFDERVRERFPHLAESWDRLWAYVDHRAFGPDDAGEARSLEWHTTALRLNKLRQRICGLALSAQSQDGPPDNG